MEDFSTDEPLVEGLSNQNSDNGKPKKKTVKATPAITDKPIETFQPTFQGKKDDTFSLEKSQNEFPSSDLGVNTSDYENYGNIYRGQNLDKMRANNQSNWDRLGNLAIRVGANIVGGTISSLGSVPAIGQGIIDEVRNKDADFTNSVTEFGDNIKDWARKNFPNYRENPNESWDISDPAFWFGGVESGFSTLEFMVGSLGAVKGAGAVAKLLRAEKLLGAIGANTEKLKLGAKIATGAAFSRNAENMMESFQLVKDTKTNLLSEWEKDPESFDKVKNSEIGEELSKEGREVNKENLASFIAGKAGWEAYGINSLNIGFDALQIAPLFKGFNPSTRLGKFSTNSKVSEANRKLFNAEAASATKLDKTFDILNPMISSIGRSASEGVEEVINYAGGLKGRNLVNKLTGKSEEDINIGEATESGFWGLFGGLAYEGTTKLLNKNKSNSDTENRIGEIYNRVNILKEGSDAIKNINERDDIDDNTKKDLINSTKSELSLDLGLRAAQAGNIDLLLDQVQSKEFKDKLVELDVAHINDVDKAISKTKDDILLAEKLYKDYYNSFQTAEGDENVKNQLIRESVVTDFFVRKNNERKNDTSKEIDDLKSNDSYILNYQGQHLESAIELEALRVAKKGISKFTNKATKKEDSILSTRGTQELEKINNRIETIKKQIGKERINLNQINPDIISKQAEVTLMDGVNNIQSAKLREYRKPENIKKVKNDIEKATKERKDKDLEDFKKGVDQAKTVEDLSNIKQDIIEDPNKNKVVEDKIQKLQDEKKIEDRKDEVTKDLNFPLVEDGFGDLPQFEIQDLDKNKVNPGWKSSIDNFVETRNIRELHGLTGEPLYNAGNPNEVIYTRNKVQEARNKSKQVKETIELNTQFPKGEFSDFDFDEFGQDDKVTTSGKNLDDFEGGKVEESSEKVIERPFEFLSKDISQDYIRTYIPIFGYGLQNFGYKEYFSIDKGNIVLKDKYVEIIKTLMNPELGEDTEVEIIWDKDNQYTKDEFKGNIRNEAFKIVYKGVTLSYLPTEATTKSELDKYKKLYTSSREQRHLDIINRLEFELPQTIKLRDQLSLSDKPFKTKILAKSRGTVISNKLSSIKGKFDGLYALNSNSTLDKTSLINIKNETDRFSSVGALRSGIIYGGLKDATGDKIPIPLVVSKVNRTQANSIVHNMNKLLDLLNQGKNTENQEVKDLKDLISKYIKVDKTSNYDKAIGFRVYPQGKKEDGSTTEARIEIGYKNTKGENKIAVYRKSLFNGEAYLGIFKDGKRDFKITSQEESFDKAITDLLMLKYHNIDFSLLNKNKPFTYFGKEYNSYEDYLTEEEILKTDITQVLDKKGNVVSNVFGFDNDFTLSIKADNKPSVILSSAYEKEIDNTDTSTNEVNYRDNYSLYTNMEGSSTSSKIIDEILNNSVNDNIKDVSKWLKSNISKINTSIKLDRLNNLTAASYNSEKDSITISNNKKFSESYFQQIVLHELIHSTTVSTIANYIESSSVRKSFLTNEYEQTDISEVKFIENTPKYIKDFVIDIFNLRNQAISQLTKKYGKSARDLVTGNTETFYGLETPYEFISEIMVNPNFRNEIRRLKNNSNIISRIYNAIVELLNRWFGFNINKVNQDILQNSVDKIKNVVDKQDTIHPFIDNLIVNSRTIDKFDNNFTREEIIEVTNTLEGLICDRLKNSDLKGSKVRGDVRNTIEDYNKNLCPESCRNKMDLVNKYFSTFYDRAISRVNKNFKISTAYDINRLQENQEVNKDWNDTVAQEVSSQDTVTRQIKMFIKTVPEMNSNNISTDDKGNILWDTKKSTITGLNKYVDFNIVYPYMVRNLIGSRTRAEIISRFENMGQVNPSFSYIANKLKEDSNLLAQFESNLAKKTIYDSYVVFITNKEDNKEIWIKNELKSSRYDYSIADGWTNNINSKIEKLQTDQDTLEFTKELNTLYLSIAEKAKKFDNKDELANDVYQFAGKLGVDISLPAIRAELGKARTWQDFELMVLLDQISGSILRKKKGDDLGRLNKLAKLEAVYRFDVVENSGLDISGNLIYAIRNTSFIANWFNEAKSTTKEGREAFENTLLSMSKVPELQMSNWLWNKGGESTGFLNYKIENGIKIPIRKGDILQVNWDFVKNINYHDFGGAKETISKDTQKYSEFVDNDWKLINLINYLNLNDKDIKSKNREKEYVLIPSIIASDSGKSGLFRLPKVKLNSNDFTRFGKDIIVKPESKLFQAILNTTRQEVRRIQQVTEQIFDIVDNKLVVKKELDTSNLQQYYHYGKEFDYKDLNKSLLNEDGTPKGKAFYFQNMLVKEGDNFITLNDILDTNSILLGQVSKDIQDKIKAFTQRFVNQQVKNSISNYKDLEVEVAEKHNNVVDGSFEGLITEYILNHYIANIEQFNFFNGTIAEYKDKIDTNKRAKQLFTPGIGLSEEAMKIQYENGSFSDGITYRGIIMKDIKTVSHTIDFIINTIKDRIIQERKYSKTDIKNFSLQGVKSNNLTSKLEQDVYSIIGGYLSINAGDAQGYCTLDRYEMVLRGRGEYPDSLSKVIDKARKGETLSLSEYKSIKPLKPFYYGRDYDSANNKMTSTQVKYSIMPLIPSLVKGSELQKLMDYMNKNLVDEAVFESGAKVGAKSIQKIHNDDGSIDDLALNKSIPYTYFNKNYKIQLDTPEHLLDEENLLAIQISKLIIGNLDSKSIYKVGDKEYSASKLISHYFDIWSDNIQDSAVKLLKDLNVKERVNGFSVQDEDIRNILIEEIEKRGLSDNYNYAIELNEEGEFKLPLFINNMSAKWESILTSLFTNRIVKQKITGGSAVLGSRLFLDKSLEQSNSNITGIKWSKEKESDKTLRSFFTKDGKTQVVEVLLGGWNSSLYKNGELMNIDEIPDEVKTMIGYRIPTTSKSYMTMFKVVGFLPEESKGLVITPDDMITQMGQDFDIDKWFLINKDFYTTKKGKFIVPDISNRKEFDILQQEVKDLRTDLYSAGHDEATKKLSDDIAKAYGLTTTEELETELKDKEERLKELGHYDQEFNFVFNNKRSRAARNNEIFDIYKAVLTNPIHFKEILTPSGYPNITKVSDEISKIFKEDDKNINPATEEGQRTFRRRNIVGKDLLGISANLNGFMAIAQVSKMKLNDNIAFKFKFNLNNYNYQELLDRYGEDIELDDNNHATIKFKNLGTAPDGSYLNTNGELILEVGSEGVVAAADNAKDPRLEKMNLSTYTYPLYHSGVSTGVPVREMGFFIRQPIIKALNDYYFDNKSLLNDESGQQIETIKRYYQTILYTELNSQNKLYGSIKNLNDKIKEINNKINTITDEYETKNLKEKLKKYLKKLDTIQRTYKNADKRIKLRSEQNIVNSYDKKYIIYVDREDIKDILEYDPSNLDVFSAEELKEQLEFKVRGYKNLSKEERLKYLKTQLQIIEYFNRWKKAGEGVQDMARVVKTDSIGAGPSMDTTTELIRTIDRLENNERVLIDNKPAIISVYPSHFNLDEESVYPPLEAYLNYGNKLSLNVLDSFFINQTTPFKNVIKTINGLIRPVSSLSEIEINTINKYLNSSLLQGFDKFINLNKSNILGISKSINSNLEVDINTFKNLSTANKVSILKQKYKDYLITDTQHILNFLTPILDESVVKENGYHKVDFLFYKNEFTDDNLADSIVKMYETGNDFEKDLAESLISYSFISNGLTFGLKSFSKVIPSEILYKIGLGDYLKSKQVELRNNISGFDNTTIDNFFKNNWNNASIVPAVRTKWDYEVNDKGKKVVRKDSQGNRMTKDRSPIWDSKSKVLIISDKSLKTLPDITKASPFVSIWSEDGVKLYKKYSRIEFNEETQKERKLTSFDGNTYYYQVNKLGKDGIIEYTENSMFEDNNVSIKEGIQISDIEDIIYKIKQQKNQPKTDNTSKSKQDELIDKCKL